MKYSINPKVMDCPKTMSSWELAMNTRQAVKAMLAVFLAGRIELTQKGYDKLDDSLKSLFIAVEES